MTRAPDHMVRAHAGPTCFRRRKSHIGEGVMHQTLGCSGFLQNIIVLALGSAMVPPIKAYTLGVSHGCVQRAEAFCDLFGSSGGAPGALTVSRKIRLLRKLT